MEGGVNLESRRQPQPDSRRVKDPLYLVRADVSGSQFPGVGQEGKVSSRQPDPLTGAIIGCRDPVAVRYALVPGRGAGECSPS